MELFDKKFVYFMWDDALKNKYAFLEDSIAELERMVNTGHDSNKHKVLGQSDRGKYPFLASNDYMYLFAYYDPLYDYKVAYNNGASIEYRRKDSENWITDISSIPDPIWDDERYEYRVKPKETAATNRKVLEWLAKGNGVVKAYQNTVTISFCIGEEDMNKPCMHKVCKWEDREWHDATRKYLGIEEN